MAVLSSVLISGMVALSQGATAGGLTLAGLLVLDVVIVELTKRGL